MKFSQAVQQVENRGRSLIVLANKFDLKEWQSFELKCKNMLKSIEEVKTIMDESYNKITKYDIEQLTHFQVTLTTTVKNCHERTFAKGIKHCVIQATNSELATQINKQKCEVSGLKSDLAQRAALLGEEQRTQGLLLLDR